MSIAIQNRRQKPRLPTTKIKTIAQTILNGLECPKADLSIVLCGDEEIRELNSLWRDKDKATDVLSFSQLEGDMPQPEDIDISAAFGAMPAPETEVLGDVVISMQRAQEQAQNIGHSLEAECRRLLVHGVLHLLGHDHVHGGRQAKKMRLEEDRLLGLLDEELGSA